MKYIQFIKMYPSNIKFLLTVSFLMFYVYSAMTQDSETPSSDTAVDSAIAEENEVIEKIPLRIGFDAFKINEDIKLAGKIRTKPDKKFQNTPGVIITLYKEEVGENSMLAKDTSNYKGEFSWTFPLKELLDSMTSVSFIVSVTGHPDFEDGEQSVTVTASVMDAQLSEEDSVRYVKVFAGYPDSGEIRPLVEAECKLFVRRLFGVMPIGEPATTDEEGNVVFEFPNDIPGDENGNIEVVVRIAEHEIVGNVERSQLQTWGVPTKEDDFYKKRQLWSARSNSPWLLVAVVNLILLGIWGTIAFIFLEIFRINKLGKARHTS